MFTLSFPGKTNVTTKICFKKDGWIDLSKKWALMEH